jgi:hypothetical protein
LKDYRTIELLKKWVELLGKWAGYRAGKTQKSHAKHVAWDFKGRE